MGGEDSQSLKACTWTMQAKALEGHGEDDEQRELLSRKVGAFRWRRQEFPYRDVSCSSTHHLRLQAAS